MSANGRFISNTLGRSKKFNRLPDHFTKLVYMHAITHADAEGRIEADAVDWYANDFVLDDDASIDRVEAAIRKLGEVGLIHLYEVRGKRYAVFTDFHEHNTIYRHKDGPRKGLPLRESASRIPPPPSSDRAESAQSLRSSRAETKSEVEVEVEAEVEDQVETSPPTPPRPDLDAQERAEEDLEQAQRIPPRGSDRLQALQQRHPTVWEELGKASTDRGWKPQQFRAIALSVYELADRYGEASTRQAVLDMVMAGDRVYSPAGWLKHRLESPRDVPPSERVYEDVDGGDLLGIGSLNGKWGPS